MDKDNRITENNIATRFGRPMLDRMPSEEKKALIQRVLSSTLYAYTTGMERVKTAEEASFRVGEYIMQCAETGNAPTVEGMCLMLGIPKGRLNDYIQETRNVAVIPGLSAVLVNGKDMIASFDANMVLENKFNPQAYIFRAKNYYGMVDRTEHAIEAKTPLESLEEQEDKETILKRIAESIDFEEM